MDRKAAARFARSSLVLASVCSAVRVAVVTQEDVVDATDATPTPTPAPLLGDADNLSDATSDHGFLLVGAANVDWPEPQAEPGIAADVEQEQDDAAMTPPPPPPGAVGADLAQDFFENNFAGYEDPFPLHYFTEPGPNGTGATPAEAPANMEVDFDMHQEQSSRGSSASSTSAPVEDESQSPSRGGGSGAGPVPEEVEQETSPEEASSEDNNSRSDDVQFSEKQFSDAVNQAMQEAGGAEFAFRGSSAASSSELEDAAGGSSEAYHGMDWMEGNLGSGTGSEINYSGGEAGSGSDVDAAQTSTSDEQENESATAGATYTSAASGGHGILMADELGASIAQRLAYPYGSASRGSF